MVTVNAVNIIILLLGCICIWAFLSDEFKEELGSFVGIFIEFVWIIAWIVYFPVMGHNAFFYIK